MKAVAVLLAGCAVAGMPQPGGAPPDAQQGTSADAPQNMQADAPQNVQADAAIDAPSGACGHAFTGVLATWTFAGQPGSQATTTAMSSAAGITAGSVQRASALTASSGASSMNSSNWAIGAIDKTKYYSLTLAPASGCGLSITSVAIDVKSSSTGPAMAVIASSADNYAQQAAVSTSAASTPALTATASGMLELRVYGFSATSAAGTMRVQNTLTVTGSIQ